MKSKCVGPDEAPKMEEKQRFNVIGFATCRDTGSRIHFQSLAAVKKGIPLRSKLETNVSGTQQRRQLLLRSLGELVSMLATNKIPPRDCGSNPHPAAGKQHPPSRCVLARSSAEPVGPHQHRPQQQLRRIVTVFRWRRQPKVDVCYVYILF